MPDPLRTDGPRALDAPDADRDAKIERLLLVGLDHYFAAQYEQAVNVWTRALFLDRIHPRARAYIDRARSALAERQRRSEELLQTGVAAFHRGDVAEARRVIQTAIDAGAPADEAFAILDRLDRLQQTPAPCATDRPRADRRRTAMPRVVVGASRGAIGFAVVLTLAMAAVVAGAYEMSIWDRPAWRSLASLTHAPAAPAVGGAIETALPLPRRGEMALGRAQALAASGHLHDALTALEAVRPTDPQKTDADRLRADIQHQLLGVPTGLGGDRHRP